MNKNIERLPPITCRTESRIYPTRSQDTTEATENVELTTLSIHRYHQASLRLSAVNSTQRIRASPYRHNGFVERRRVAQQPFADDQLWHPTGSTSRCWQFSGAHGNVQQRWHQRECGYVRPASRRRSTPGARIPSRERTSYRHPFTKTQQTKDFAVGSKAATFCPRT